MIQTICMLLAIIFASFCLLSKVDSYKWWLRAFDFPKVQLWWMLLSVIIAVLLFAELDTFGITTIAICLLAMAHTALYFWPYLSFTTPESRAATPDNNAPKINLVVANVEMENTKHADLLNIINQQTPDVVLLIETDDKWHAAMQPLQDIYPHRVEHPNPSHSGMLLYSKYPLINPELRYLVKDYIPSITTQIQLKRNRAITLYAVHPRPPRPQNSALGRDNELSVVAAEVASLGDTPVIVAGDMNDVGWSNTTASFQQDSGLLDPRKGRGLYSSYHAKFPLWRWPLDHVFHSHHFSVVSLERLPAFGSDHFPLQVTLQLEC